MPSLITNVTAAFVLVIRLTNPDLSIVLMALLGSPIAFNIGMIVIRWRTDLRDQ